MTAVVRIAVLMAVSLFGGVVGLRAQPVQVTRIDGAMIEGRLKSVDEQLQLETTAGVLHIPVDELMSLRPALVDTAPEAPQAWPLQIELADGSLFGGRVESTEEQGFTVSFAGGKCQLDPRNIRAIHVATAPVAAKRKFDELLREEAGADDVIVAGRGDDAVVLHGVLRRVEAARIVFGWNGKDTPIPWERLGGVRMAAPTARGSACLVTLHSGDVLGGRISSDNEETLSLRSGVFREVSLKWTQVARIDWRSERVVYLSAMRPANYEQQPLFGKEWPLLLDRTFTGAAIRVGAREYARGVVMHSRSRVTFALGGEFEKLAATVGILDEMKQRGAVAMRVLGDGKPLWEAAAVRGGQPPQEIALDVVGVESLTLEVDYGDDLDLSDEAAWAAARVIRGNQK